MQGRHIGLAVAVLLCCGLSARAQYVDIPGANGLPKLQYFHQYNSGDESLQLDDVQEVTETIGVIEKDSTGREQLIPKIQNRQLIERWTYRVSEVRAISLKGDELKLADVFAKLKSADPVIVVAKGRKLPAGFDRVLRDDVVILEVPTAYRFSGPQRDSSPAFAPPPGDTRPIIIPNESPRVEERPRLSSPPVLPLTIPPPGVRTGPSAPPPIPPPGVRPASAQPFDPYQKLPPGVTPQAVPFQPSNDRPNLGTPPVLPFSPEASKNLEY